MEQEDVIIEQANKCLHCNNAQCRKGCPISTNIPEFINEIKNKNFLKSYEILQENNFMSEICSTICPVEEQCMGKCIRGIKGTPVKINFLENYINQWANGHNIEYKPKIDKKSNKKIAVIGAGPARLIMCNRTC